MSVVQTKSVASFDVQYLQFINEHSQLTQALPDFASDQVLLYFYQKMAWVRAYDVKATNLQRTGRLGGYASCRGQEALGVAIGHALKKEDVLSPHYRDQAAQFIRGNSLGEVLNIWGGDEWDCHYQHPDLKQDLPALIPIGTQCLQAAGIAYAMKYRREKRVVLTVCGDGGTSKGDFYEAMNLAGQWQLPIVFVINNNQWAISVAREQQTHAQTLAQKAIAAGFSGLQVDGNDVVANRYAIAVALEKARRGEGPSLIESITYRLSDHTTADDAKRYQPSEQVKQAWKVEPVNRLGVYLESKKLWSREQEKEFQAAAGKKIDEEIAAYLARPNPKPTDMFDYLYAELPDALQEQRDLLLQEQQS